MTAGGRRHDIIIVRFEEFLEAHPDEPRSDGNLRGDWRGGANAPSRSEHLGMAPIVFFPCGECILSIAHSVGRSIYGNGNTISHQPRLLGVGRFSVAYRALFGESPSESLRRPPDDHRIFLNRPSSLDGPVWRLRAGQHGAMC